MQIKLPSLELNWLRKYYKGYSVPDMYYYPQLKNCYNGLYFRNSDYEPYEALLYDEHINEIDSILIKQKGAIVLCGEYCIENTIAHEYRHHIQFNKLGTMYDEEELSWDYISYNYDYWDAIIKYYAENIYEFDALKYSITKAPCDHELQCYELVMDYLKTSII